MLRNGFLLGLLALLTGCAAAPPDTHDADVQALKDTEAAWVKDAASKDADKFAARYADDGSLLIANMPVVTGKEAIRNAMKPMMADPNFSLQFSSTRQDVAKSGDLGYTQGSYTLTLSNPKDKQPITDKGKYVTIFRKQADGSWKVVADSVSSDLPLPGEAPTK